MNPFDTHFHTVLAARRAAHLLRQLPPPLTGQVDFCSNDYLGFARSNSAAAAAGRVGATGSRLISGNSPLAEQLESELAAYHHAEAALLFTSGYAANLGLLQAVTERQDTLIYDKLVHASLRDGILLTRARALGFAHNDVADLQKKLAAASGRVLVVVESVYSMDGDVAPLRAIAAACQAAGAALLVDEAHGTGVCGDRGEGLVVAEGLQDQVWARVHTFGKAIGSHGAAVVGSRLLRDYLLNFARSFIYSTALPDHTLAVIQQAYQQLPTGVAIRQLHERIAYFQQQCSPAVRARLLPGNTPIQAFLCPGNAPVMALAQELQRANMAVLPIRHPTVPAGQERLRICLHAYNTEAEIDQLLAVLARLA
ncbi:MAG: 8-amino-7-oxononanoate synthase [Bacteroidetes bacterium]|nr:MAG: 8-amino-7-oxononanoate synthase [Bacteroidota bacterium]PTM10112.1 MAG: 8-amino-7-oxononanoate synthase [Bacteroidota bacterium]